MTKLTAEQLDANWKEVVDAFAQVKPSKFTDEDRVRFDTLLRLTRYQREKRQGVFVAEPSDLPPPTREQVKAFCDHYFPKTGT